MRNLSKLENIEWMAKQTEWPRLGAFYNLMVFMICWNVHVTQENLSIMPCKSIFTNYPANTYYNVSIQTLLLNSPMKCVVWTKCSLPIVQQHKHYSCMNYNCCFFLHIPNPPLLWSSKIFLCNFFKDIKESKTNEWREGCLHNLKKTLVMMGKNHFYKEFYSSLFKLWKMKGVGMVIAKWGTQKIHQKRRSLRMN